MSVEPIKQYYQCLLLLMKRLKCSRLLCWKLQQSSLINKCRKFKISTLVDSLVCWYKQILDYLHILPTPPLYTSDQLYMKY